MKAHLLYKDKDYVNNTTSINPVLEDLWFTTIINNLCVYDKKVKEIYLDSLNLMTTDIDTIKYRQDILKDCIRNKNLIMNYYNYLLKLNTHIYNSRYEISLNKTTSSYYAAYRVIPEIMKALEHINKYFETIKHHITSEGLTRYIDEFLKVFNLEYLNKLNDTLTYLSFENGIFVTGSLTDSLELGNYVVYDILEGKKKIVEKQKLDDSKTKSGYHNLYSTISSYDKYEYIIKENQKFKHAKVIESPKATSSEEEEYTKQTDIALIPFANKVVSIVDDIVKYFDQTVTEMAFYVGGINLYEKLMKIGVSICNPKAINSDKRTLKTKGLCDIALALQTEKNPSGNDIDIENKNIIYISGANQGGKTTFLRSYGQALIMMQLGLFVSGEAFTSSTVDKIFTHYNREEDKSMTSGKLDEELKRFGDMVDDITPNSLVLFNESFSSTSEVEGSNIAYDIIRALEEKNVSVAIVSHMYTLSNLLAKNYDDKTAYLRAGRNDDGTRSYKLMPLKPLETSFALDLYNEMFKGEKKNENQ